MSQSGYLLGIGSNIQPQHNIAEIIRLLQLNFPTLTLSRVLEIPPIGMNSAHDFLNIVVFIETSWSEKKLKTLCNKIEIQLGRDRTDPDKKHKDRPADLDILTHLQLPKEANRPVHSITDEYFLYPLLNEVIAYLVKTPFELAQAGMPIQSNTLSFGQTATTINGDTSSRNERIA